MKSLLLALILASSCPASTSIYDTQRSLVVEFDKYFDRYARALFGCQSRVEMTPETCHDWESHIDYVSYSKAAELAAKLFPQEK